MPSILFICSANMCRSPMAEALFNHMMAEEGKIGWYAASAGVWAFDGSRASEGAVREMERRGIDIRNHRARSIQNALMSDCDLILTMEENHKVALQTAFPKLSPKIYKLTEMVGKSRDIRDPIGGSAADYEDTANELDGLLHDGWMRIQALAYHVNDDEVG